MNEDAFLSEFEKMLKRLAKEHPESTMPDPEKMKIIVLNDKGKPTKLAYPKRVKK